MPTAASPAPALEQYADALRGLSVADLQDTDETFYMANGMKKSEIKRLQRALLYFTLVYRYMGRLVSARNHEVYYSSCLPTNAWRSTPP